MGDAVPLKNTTSFSLSRSVQSFKSSVGTKRWWCARPKHAKLPRWKIALIVGAILVAFLFAIIIAFGIIPAIVQSVVNEAVIQFEQVNITEPTPTSFRMWAKGKLTNASPFTADIQETQLTIYINDKVLGSLVLPPVTAAANGDSELELDTTIQIASAEVFNEFSQTLINDPAVVWQVVGMTNIEAIGRTFQNVNFAKDIEISALNGLPDVTIVVFDLTESTAEEIIVVMTVRVNNPSVVAMIPLGDLQLEMSYKGAFMGYLSAPSVSMYRQENVLAMRGKLDPTDLVLAGELMSRYLTGQESAVVARGSMNATTVELYMAALQSMTLNTQLVADETQLVTALLIHNLTMILQTETQLALNGYIYVEIFNPLGNDSLITLNTVSLAVDLLTSAGAVSARMEAASVALTAVTDLSYIIQVQSITAVQSDQFALFVNDFLFMNETSITLQGSTTVNATIPIGQVDLTGLKLVSSASLRGLDGLQPGTIRVQQVTIVGAHVSGLYMRLTLAVYNPSNVNLELGAVGMDLYFNDAYIGQTVVPEFSAAMGWSQLEARAVYQHPGEVPGRAFLSQFLAGVDQSLALTGSANASTYSFLLPAFQSLQTSTVLPGQTARLVTFAQLVLDILSFTLATKLTINNPFNTTLWVNSIDTMIYFSGTTLARLTADLSANPIVVPPNTMQQTQSLPVTLLTFNVGLLGSLFGNVNLDVSGPLYVSIDGQFNTTVDFSIVNLPASFQSP